MSLTYWERTSGKLVQPRLKATLAGLLLLSGCNALQSERAGVSRQHISPISSIAFAYRWEWAELLGRAYQANAMLDPDNPVTPFDLPRGASASRQIPQNVSMASDERRHCSRALVRVAEIVPLAALELYRGMPACWFLVSCEVLDTERPLATDTIRFVMVRQTTGIDPIEVPSLILPGLCYRVALVPTAKSLILKDFERVDPLAPKSGRFVLLSSNWLDPACPDREALLTEAIRDSEQAFVKAHAKAVLGLIVENRYLVLWLQTPVEEDAAGHCGFRDMLRDMPPSVQQVVVEVWDVVARQRTCSFLDQSSGKIVFDASLVKSQDATQTR